MEKWYILIYIWAGASISYAFIIIHLRNSILNVLLMETSNSIIPNTASSDNTGNAIWEIPNLPVKQVPQEYSKANAIVEQALSSIKTVYSFTAEGRIIERYSEILERISRLGLKQGIAKGLAVGSSGLSFAIWAFMAWYGSRLVMYKAESGGRIYASAICFILSGLYVI